MNVVVGIGGSCGVKQESSTGAQSSRLMRDELSGVGERPNGLLRGRGGGVRWGRSGGGGLAGAVAAVDSVESDVDG
jgi:hypothetical protein